MEESKQNNPIEEVSANRRELSSNSNINQAALPEYDSSSFKGVDSMEKLNFLKDLQLNIFIELGRTQMQIKEILELERGYVIELDKLASEPVDIYVNNKKIAEGEVVVIDKHFGIRIVNLIDVASRLKGL
ncbi:MAG: flagellar motor switch protein FliN [Ignavibacteriaceae bacterium]|nr:flagellar motor switch protein FliN [Ignavibacteriaceae bacterium]